MEPSGTDSLKWVNQLNHHLTNAYLEAVDQLENEDEREQRKQTTEAVLVHPATGLVKLGTKSAHFIGYRRISQSDLATLSNPKTSQDVCTQLIAKLAKEMSLFPSGLYGNGRMSKAQAFRAYDAWQRGEKTAELKRVGITDVIVDPTSVPDQPSVLGINFFIPGEFQEMPEGVNQAVKDFLAPIILRQK